MLRPCFTRIEPWVQEAKYAAAVMCDLRRRDGWTIAERSGDRTTGGAAARPVHTGTTSEHAWLAASKWLWSNSEWLLPYWYCSSSSLYTACLRW